MFGSSGIANCLHNVIPQEQEGELGIRKGSSFHLLSWKVSLTKSANHDTKNTLCWRVVQAEIRTTSSRLCMKFKSVIKDVKSCIFKEQQLKDHNRNHCVVFKKAGS